MINHGLLMGLFKKLNTPRFKAGDVIQFGTYECEEWESPIIYTILKVGKHSYQIAFDAGNGDIVKETLRFDKQFMYKKIL